jgi:hypothetical protein
MTRLALFALTASLLATAGCRTCGDRRSSNRDDRDCTTSRIGTSRQPANCDPVMTGYGQPIMQGSVVGAIPSGAPISGSGDGELPFPQSTIPSPGVPSAPPVASIPSPAFGVRK